MGKIRNPIRLPEAAIQRLILDWLAAEHIWHIRLNTGAMAGSHNGKKWFVKFGRPGMADILAVKINLKEMHSDVFWIECKAEGGKQSSEQRMFQTEVIGNGMNYVLAYSLEDVRSAFNSQKIGDCGEAAEREQNKADSGKTD